MTHTYKITGMTCTGCQARVQQLLSAVPNVSNVSIDLAKSIATVDMTAHVETASLQAALQTYPKYQLSESAAPLPASPVGTGENAKSWLTIYKPILLIGTYIAGIATAVALTTGHFSGLTWMRYFMAGFFLTFSFFKLLDLEGFADSYAMYDIIARRIRNWGYVYPFVELFLGIAYLIDFNQLVTNAITFIVMSVSIIGVLQSVLNKRKIRCACLGAVFNLPMSTITIIEDLLMIAMSAFMLVTML